MERLSVVIANYNYARYVATAIESALALRWGDVEIVVVDDGSTDDSPAVIQTYADQVQILLTENSSQRVAVNRGYALTTGDVVVFLDSDDVLPPDLPERLAAGWSPAVSKAQFRMQCIDEFGQSVGSPFPDFKSIPTPAEIRLWVSQTTAYPTPPGSGNAYARSFLEKIFPVSSSVGDFSDSACLAAAPFFGDVITIPSVVVGYRRHGTNDSNLLLDDSRFPREVQRARERWMFAQRAVGERSVDEKPLFRSRELLQLRVAAWKVAPDERPLPGDGLARMILDSLRAPFPVGPESLTRRLMIAGWCLVTLIAPRRVARKLLAVRYGRRQ